MRVPTCVVMSCLNFFMLPLHAHPDLDMHCVLCFVVILLKSLFALRVLASGREPVHTPAARSSIMAPTLTQVLALCLAVRPAWPGPGGERQRAQGWPLRVR